MKRWYLVATLGLSLSVVSCTKAPQRPHLLKGETSKSGDGDLDGDGVIDDLNGDGVITDEEGNTLSLMYSTGFPRLSHNQWDNSVRDILLLDKSPDLSKNFAADPSDSIYNNNQSLLKVSATLWGDYRDAAEAIAATVSSNAALMKKLTPANVSADPVARAKEITAPILKRAFRRPPTDAELKTLSTFFAEGKKYSDKADATAAGFEALITAVLQSPTFIYRPELGDAKGEDTVHLNAYEVASRLSYAVYNSIPDEELFAAAASGEILSSEGLKKQVKRMMKDKKAEATLDFWLYKAFNLAKYKTAPKKDEKKYPLWPKDMGDALEKEASLFLHDVVVTNKGGLAQILTANYTYVNSLTAPLYGVDAPKGTEFAKVELDKEKRLGFLTQLGYLATRAHANETDPIHRGTFIAGEILCTILAVPPVTEKVPPPSDQLKTVRDRVAALTNAGSCAGCHKGMINPAGFAFENYDGIGAWQEMDNGVKIDSTGEYIFPQTANGSIKFEGALDLIKELVKKRPAHTCYVQKAVEMLYGRLPDLRNADKKRLEVLTDKSLSGASTEDLFIEILSDPIMLVRSNHVEEKK